MRTRFPVWLIVLLVLAGAFLLWLMTGYNGLVSSKEYVDNQWRGVEAQYQRRFDLIPNVVNTVKGAANFEQSTLLAVTNARTQWLNASGDRTQQVNAAQNFDSALSRLLVSVESYPKLEATQAFRDLMTELEGTENRITVARKDYNDSVYTYNLKVKRFPGTLIASLFGFMPEEGFRSTAGSELPPAVQF